MEKQKELSLFDFICLIEKSWTYDKLTKEERKQLYLTFNSERTREALKGTYKQRWDILQAIYGAFLAGVGYDDYAWREELEDIPLF